MRGMLVIMAAWVSFAAAIPNLVHAQATTLAEDWKVLQSHKWVNHKPATAWTKLRRSFDGVKGPAYVYVHFHEASDTNESGELKYRLDFGFSPYGFGKCEPRLFCRYGPTWRHVELSLQENPRGRYLVLTARYDVEHKIEYSLTKDMLTMKGTYYGIDPEFGTPAVFDGEFVRWTGKKGD